MPKKVKTNLALQELTEDQQLDFARKVIAADLNLRDAAKEYGISVSVAREWMKSDIIQGHVKRLLLEGGCTAQRVELSLVDIMDADPADYEDVRGGTSLKEIRDRGIDTRLVKKLKVTPSKYGDKIEYELYDKVEAIDRLIEILGLSKKQGGNGGGDTNVSIGILQQAMPDGEGVYGRLERQFSIVEESARAGDNG